MSQLVSPETNEELQSTNEELEIMNEELQFGNEELQTSNDELCERTDEVNRSKAFLESILASLHAAAVVVDPNFHILMWNAEANELWGLLDYEVLDQSLVNLDIGLSVEQLRTPGAGRVEQAEPRSRMSCSKPRTASARPCSAASPARR